MWYAALQYVDVPGYAALVLRRTFSELSLPRSLMSRSHEYLTGMEVSGKKAVWNDQRKTWTFPSGATITFGYLEKENDRYRYASAEFQCVLFDELTTFPEESYRFLFTRLRRLQGMPVPLRMRSASNPGGIGHQWVFRRFVDEKTRAKEAVFIPAKLADNPSLDREEYVQSLANVDPITRSQILDGDWNAHQGGRFKKEWFRRFTKVRGGPYGAGEYRLVQADGSVRCVSERDCWRFMTVDPAASSLETSRSRDPDWTVIASWTVTPRGELLWTGCHRFRAEVPDIVPQIQSVYSLDLPEYVAIEAVAANRAVLQIARRTSMVVKEVSPRGQDKLVRATKALVLAESGKLYLPEGAHWLEDVEGELLRFTGDDRLDAHDDCVDVLSYAAASVEEFGDGDDGALPLVIGGRAW